MLVVDDNRTNRLVLASQLRAWDVVADVAEDAQDALLRLRLGAGAYDAAVLDMDMPGTDADAQHARVIASAGTHSSGER